MADSSLYPDNLDDSLAHQPESDEAGSSHDDMELDVDAEPNDTDSQLLPPVEAQDDPGDLAEDELIDEEPADEDSGDDGFGDEDLIDEEFGDEEPGDEDEGFGDEDSDDEDPDGEDSDNEDFIDEESGDQGLLDFDEPNDTDARLSTEQLAGIISFVGVPIGNHADITQRAVRTLQVADVVVCEDFKAAARLLRNFNMTKKLLEMNERNEEKASEDVIKLVRAGKRVAVIAGAGLPMLAGPGSILAVKLRRMGVEPRIIPGVSSVMTGLMASGFSMESFDFVGVLPRRPEERRSALENIAGRDRTIVMMEAPFRLRSLLVALAEVMPNRQAALTINLTAPFESVIRGTVAELNARFAQRRFKGDLVLVLDKLEATDLGAGMSAGASEMGEDYESYTEEDLANDAGAKPVRRTTRTPAFRTDDRREDTRETPAESGDRPERADQGKRPQQGGWNRDGGSSRPQERRPSSGGGGWNRDGGSGRPQERRPSSGGGGRPEGRPSSGGGGWNRDGGSGRPQERRPSSGGGGRPEGRPSSGGGWNRDGGSGRPQERRPSSGGWGGGGGRPEGRPSGGGGWNRDGGSGRPQERRPSSGGWGGGGGRPEGRPSSGGGGGWNRDGGSGRPQERRPSSGGWGGGGGRPEGRPSSGGGSGWNRDGGSGRPQERRPSSGGWGGGGGRPEGRPSSGGGNRGGGSFRGSGPGGGGKGRSGPPRKGGWSR